MRESKAAQSLKICNGSRAKLRTWNDQSFDNSAQVNDGNRAALKALSSNFETVGGSTPGPGEE
eukprot:5230438-Pyramimonas_sp.AAC.1